MQTLDRAHYEPEKSFTKVPRITVKSNGKISYISFSLIWKSHVTKKSFGKVETLPTRDLQFIVREDYQKWGKRDSFCIHVSHTTQFAREREDLKNTSKSCRHVEDKDYFPRFILPPIYY